MRVPLAWLSEAADGEALAGFFDDDVVVSDKRAFDGDVVVRAATNTHGVVVDAVDVAESAKKLLVVVLEQAPDSSFINCTYKSN